MKPTLRLIVFALFGTLLLWAAYLGIMACAFGRNWQESGQFGDTFGALNTLFTGWAFVAVFATLIQQSKQIEETKREMAEERELQKRTAELVHQQAEALSLAARLEALTARIDAYHVQIQDAGPGELRSRLVGERYSLLLKLDQVLRSHGD